MWELLGRFLASKTLGNVASLARLGYAVHEGRQVSLTFHGSVYWGGGYYYLLREGHWSYWGATPNGQGNWFVCQAPMGAGLVGHVYHGSDGTWHVQTGSGVQAIG